MIWNIVSKLPENEPNDSNFADYAHEQLIAGASDDGRYLFDVIYVLSEECFVLTLMELNAELAFMENQLIMYPTSREELLQLIHEFKTDPAVFFQIYV
ncbi:MAG: hypothetical protein IJR46_08610 [Neisseriaceae bacterium]|nr:hypothetical protein [Neisseriaceae bacterium]